MVASSLALAGATLEKDFYGNAQAYSRVAGAITHDFFPIMRSFGGNYWDPETGLCAIDGEAGLAAADVMKRLVPSMLMSVPLRRKTPKKVLQSQEGEKKSKYLQACLKQHRTFAPFVVSTDGMMGTEADNLIKRIAKLLAEKWSLPYSQVCGLVRARMSIAIARTTHMCLCGSRVPASRTSRRPQWEDGAGVSLFQTDY